VLTVNMCNYCCHATIAARPKGCAKTVIYLLLLGLWAGIPPPYVTRQLEQFSLRWDDSTFSELTIWRVGTLASWSATPSLTGWGKGGNVTTTGWHMASEFCNGEVYCKLLHSVYFTSVYLRHVHNTISYYLVDIGISDNILVYS